MTSAGVRELLVANRDQNPRGNANRTCPIKLAGWRLSDGSLWRMGSPADRLQKPRMRGRLHQIAFFVSVPAGIALVALADTGRARLATAIFAVGLAGVFGASAAYHRVAWTDPARRRMKRLDHSMIFVLIAGTYTPFCLLALSGQRGPARGPFLVAGQKRTETGEVRRQGQHGQHRYSGRIPLPLAPPWPVHFHRDTPAFPPEVHSTWKVTALPV